MKSWHHSEASSLAGQFCEAVVVFITSAAQVAVNLAYEGIVGHVMERHRCCRFGYKTFELWQLDVLWFFLEDPCKPVPTAIARVWCV